MGIFRLLIVAVLALFAQVALLPHVEVRHAVPDLLVVVVAFAALHAPIEAAATLAFLVGGIADCLSVAPFGTHAAIYLVAALLFRLLRRWVFREDLLPVALMVGLVAGLLCAAHGATLAWGDSALSAGAVGARAAAVAAYTALACPFLWRPLCGLRRSFGLARPVAR